jgi:polyadenylation factor subunit 2
MAATLPMLLPGKSIPQPPKNPHLEWTPQKYRSAPQPPPQDDGKVEEQELASQRQMLDGKLIKKTRPRRTVDYNGGMGRWALVSLIFACTQTDGEHISRASYANYVQIPSMYHI